MLISKLIHSFLLIPGPSGLDIINIIIKIKSIITLLLSTPDALKAQYSLYLKRTGDFLLRDLAGFFFILNLKMRGGDIQR